MAARAHRRIRRGDRHLVRARPAAAPPFRRRGSWGAAPGLLDEVFHPQAHEARLIQEAQRELPVPAPIPGDGALEEGATRILITVASPPLTAPMEEQQADR